MDSKYNDPSICWHELEASLGWIFFIINE
jgi:hypothetical protein